MHACPSVRRQQSKTPKFKFALYIGIPGGGGARVARAVATIPKPVDQPENPSQKPNSKSNFSQISAKSQISVKSRRHGARCHTDACIVADPQITLCRPVPDVARCYDRSRCYNKTRATSSEPRERLVRILRPHHRVPLVQLAQVHLARLARRRQQLRAVCTTSKQTTVSRNANATLARLSADSHIPPILKPCATGQCALR